ncbi:MAG: hypothetical protein JSU96_11850 [Acidobacteriota bacterium]|nr:MAG: hypothetical protein JSU96_11850 [Acidobacteriota bacterium]
MKRVCLLLVFLLGTFGVLSAHDAHEGVMNVELKLNLSEGKDVTIKYRALNLGSGQTWGAIKTGESSRPFGIAEMTTSSDLMVGDVTVPAGTHQLFIVGSADGMSLQIGGSRQEPGPRVPISVMAAPSQAEHLIIGATHGEGHSDFAMFMVYGESLGAVIFDTK